MALAQNLGTAMIVLPKEPQRVCTAISNEGFRVNRNHGRDITLGN